MTALTHLPGSPIVELYNEDCIEGMRRLPASSVDIVVTSPPYNLGIKYSKYDDNLSRQEYLEWSLQWGKEVRRVLKENGSLFLNLGGSPSNPYLPHHVAIAFGESLFRLQNTIHWIKSISIDDEQGEVISRGHFKPISSHRFVNDCHEYVFHFTKDGNVPIRRLAVGVPYADKSNIARWGHSEGKDIRCRGNTWFIPYKTIRIRNLDRPHPASFPPELALQCIKLHGVEKNVVVMDPFVGIGSSAIAARIAKAQKFIGFDIDPYYIEIATSRWSESQ